MCDTDNIVFSTSFVSFISHVFRASWHLHKYNTIRTDGVGWGGGEGKARKEKPRTFKQTDANTVFFFFFLKKNFKPEKIK